MSKVNKVTVKVGDKLLPKNFEKFVFTFEYDEKNNAFIRRSAPKADLCAKSKKIFFFLFSHFQKFYNFLFVLFYFVVEDAYDVVVKCLEQQKNWDKQIMNARATAYEVAIREKDKDWEKKYNFFV